MKASFPPFASCFPPWSGFASPAPICDRRATGHGWVRLPFASICDWQAECPPIRNKKELDEIDAEQAYKRNFPLSFADAFDMLMKKNGDTRETIAEKLNVNSKSLHRWLKEPDRKINADFIVLLALIWRLPEWISALLLDRAYIQLSESNRRHLALQYILKVLWSEGVEKANAYLTARKLDCLSI